MRKQSPDTLLDKAITTDPEQLIIRKFYLELSAIVYRAGHYNLLMVIFCKAIKNSLQYGNSPESAYIYGKYGFIASHIHGDFKTGVKFGALMLKLNERFNDIESKCKVLTAYALFVQSWDQHRGILRETFEKAITAGKQTGNLQHIAVAFSHCFRWDPGMDLKTALQLGDNYLEQIKKIKSQDIIERASIAQHYGANLAGLTHDRSSLNSTDFDENVSLNSLQKINTQTGIAIFHQVLMMQEVNRTVCGPALHLFVFPSHSPTYRLPL